jgi:hypothetical protein
MTRTKIPFVFAAAFAVTLAVQGANAASLNPAKALKESTSSSLLVQAHGCHRLCARGPVKGTTYVGPHRHMNSWYPCAPYMCRWAWPWRR